MSVREVANAMEIAQKLKNGLDVIDLAEIILQTMETGNQEETQFDIFEDMIVKVSVKKTN